MVAWTGLNAKRRRKLIFEKKKKQKTQGRENCARIDGEKSERIERALARADDNDVSILPTFAYTFHAVSFNNVVTSVARRLY